MGDDKLFLAFRKVTAKTKGWAMRPITCVLSNLLMSTGEKKRKRISTYTLL